MKKRIIPIVLVAIAALGVAWWLTHRHTVGNELVLYGNIDLREVDLAFNDSQRVASVLVREGDSVRKGQVLAQLDTSRMVPQLAQAQAQAAAQRAVVDRLHHGSRPEEIAQARANLMLAQADARQSHDNYQRLETVSSNSGGRAVSRQEVDNAKAQSDVSDARVAVNRKALQLALIGPRQEDIAQAEAMLASEEARVALLEQELADAQLRAPLDAVVRSRIAEPGDMASPQKTALTLAITDPKWVRAYVSETELGRVHPGMRAAVAVDSFPGRRFPGWVGFISPEAEFTPKTVQTQELRSSLVYEIRVFVTDPGDDLRLGMPATVHLSAGNPKT
ncbi:MAG TPA: efflux RND transporter periplasmic adaptor subunit [Steroidobacteraceae bacterium]|jgi:HlyD family secretion protein|nr:efflux RND transporter periplasmic adaptor subunit [Steroidobacteraceae bacterium]